MLLKRKREGKLLTGKQKEKARMLEAMRKQLLANTNLDLSMPAKRPLYQKKKSKPQNQSNGAAISDDVETTDSKEIQLDVMKEDKPKHDNHPVQNGQNLRSPICCILGHVDTGKTKLLDCIRGTNVQEGEAGGITQQIGATYFPAENIRERTKELKADAKLNVPGLLVIDTPGHESFINLRFRGSRLCDFAVVIVDIMHGLEPQTVESLNLLKKRNVDFFVALNKVDRLYGWKTCPNAPIVKGPIVTTTRALLTPHPMRELRVKGKYLHHKEIKAAQGIKISAKGLEHAIAGTSLYVVGSDDDLEDIKQAAMKDVNSVMSRAGKCVEGVYVQASTLGSLEALLEFLKTPAVNIAVHYAKKGQKVAIEITGSSAKEKHKMFGRDFEMQDKLVSKITRSSFDAINEYYADELSGDDRRLLFKLKNLLGIF